MKKITIVLLVMGMLVLAGCSGTSNKPTLKVYAPGEYIDKEMRTAFEKENNVKVIYTTFDSNEEMYTQIQNGNKYDVLVPSDYMIERLVSEDLLAELDYAQIPNFSGVNATLLNRHYDAQQQYSAPYFWGNIGIVYNKTNVSQTDLEQEGWSILTDTNYKGRLFFYDSERDAFMIALKALGYSANTEDAGELEQAYNWLVTLRETMDPIIYGDQTIDAMIRSEKDLAVMYSGDATYVLSENEDLDYFVPSEGTNLWVDAMVVSKDSEAKDLAYAWINYMLDPEVAMANADAVGYTSPLPEVVSEITGAGGTYEGIDSYIPRTDNPKDEEFYFNYKTKEIMSEYWTKVINR